ncbi:penicillin-binding transpeptidase domain-containing protein [Glycomyces xiaoerkulensis]|uniref:penicillin-binding transpeptidase domain-containing protein n=1 Tax=Glycomyces xiaoerkulensis TaxID=2038139 RepID=UPI000C260CA4|nr:penicillin-binding transpeptidase domain-containing protein [Glycomyces xiaoerkulensis]
MEYGSTPRVSAAQRRTGGRLRSHRHGSVGPGGRHRADGGLPWAPAGVGRLHYTVAAAVGLVLAVGIVLGAERFGADEPVTEAGGDREGPLRYAGGETVPDDFAERHPGLVERIHTELERRYGLTPERLYDAADDPDAVRVVLTLDRRLQRAAEEAGSSAGVVAVEPGSGAILVYHGAHDDTGTDQVGQAAPHPPASVFDMVTAATAIEHGASIDSTWPDGGGEVTLADAVRRSRTAAIGAVAEHYGTEAVIETAIDLGITALTDGDGNVHRFAEEVDPEAFEPTEFGRYPVSVLDMAAAYATIAGNGLRARPHLVDRVLGPDGGTLQPDEGIRTEQAIATDTARDLQYIGLGHGDAIAGRDFFGLSGSWPEEPPQSWYVGAIPQLSVAAWVADAGSSEVADTAGVPVWRRVVDTAVDVKDYRPEPWEGAAGDGEDPAPSPSEEPSSEEPASEEPSEEPSDPPEATSESPDEPSEEPTEEETSDEPGEEPTDDCWFLC